MDDFSIQTTMETEEQTSFSWNEAFPGQEQQKEQEPEENLDSQTDGNKSYQIHQESTLGAIITPHGQTHITINYYQDVIQPWEHPYDSEEVEEEEEGEKDDAPASLAHILRSNLRFARQNFAPLDAPLPAHYEGTVQIPSDDATLAEMYSRIDDYTKCHILAVALLHGAASREIYSRTDELFKQTLRDKQMVLQENDLKNTPKKEPSSPPFSQERSIFTFPRLSYTELLKRTWTVSGRKDGIERLFWIDSDSNGQSAFEIRIVAFLAREYNSKGEHWEPFRERLLKWSQGRITESAWRSAHAFGMMLWYLNSTELHKLAETWAKKGTVGARKCAASLLYGAWEIERQNIAERTQSVVWHILKAWTQRAQNPANTNKQDILLACACGNTYALLGNTPADSDAALAGLDALLQIRSGFTADALHRLTSIVTSAYVSLSWAGQLRAVVSHLATLAEALTHRWQPSSQLSLRTLLRTQRDLRLNAALDATLLITNTILKLSTKDQQSLSLEKYHQALPPQIPLPETEPYDIFLAAILTYDPLASSLLILLCAALFARKSTNVFPLVKHWAKIVLALHHKQKNNVIEILTSFETFLVNLGNTIERWEQDRQHQGFRQTSVYRSYRYQLIQWYQDEQQQPEKQVLCLLLRNVLRQFSPSTDQA